MTSNLIEGQSFPPGYRLNEPVAEGPVWNSWIATNEQTGERVLVRVASANAVDDWSALTSRIDAVRGLVHENINLVHSHGTDEDICYLIEPYLVGVEKFRADEDHRWSILKQLIDVVAYIHQLGLSHGNIHPGNLLIDSKGQLHLTGMGLNKGLNKEFAQFSSPQVHNGADADVSDDIYSLGCLIYSSLTGRLWQSGDQPDAPLKANLQQLINRMMSAGVVDRNVRLAEVKETLAEHFDDAENQIAVADFSRAEQKRAEPAREIPVATRQARAFSSRQVGIGLAVLIIIAVGLFALLPESQTTVAPQITPATADSSQSPSPAQTTQTTAQVDTGPAPFEAARLEHLREEGEVLAREILRLQLDLEDHGVLLWANNRFSQLGNDLDAAENLFRDRDYEAALAAYTEIRDALQSLTTEMEPTLQREVERGDAALAAADHEEALTAFTIANAIALDDMDIKAKLDRAANLSEVLSLVRRAELQEREANYAGALDIFRSAKDLDPLWQPAANGVTRMQEMIRMQRFQDAMSAAFRAIDSKDYDAARDHFRAAEKIMPNSTEPADGLDQVAQAETNDAINALRDEAQAYVADLKWQEAIDTYQAALDITDTLAFAKEGLALASSRLHLNNDLDKYLSDPPLLQSNDELNAASGILRQASVIAAPDENLMRQIDSLAKLISTARIEIPVRIVSNGKTSVTVRKHSHLGTIETETVYLIPGRYTITGERAGFRDVREDLVLIAGRPVPEIVIASTERVR